jgi:heme exporter protein B
MKPGSIPAACIAVLRRDLALVWRRRGDALNPLMFAIIVVALFPFALGPEADVLARIAAGTIFVAVLLAGLLSLDGLFRSDLEDGSLEQLVMSPHPLALLLGCKIAVHWLTTALPLIAVAPLLALPERVLPVLLATLSMATPLLSLIGAVCVALTIGMRRSGMLLTLLVLPLLVPVLIFGAGACNAAQLSLPFGAPLLWLGAWLILALVLAPLASAAALKISLT